MTDNKKHLIIITGPTAIGKTGLSIFLAKQLNTEIVSFDSRQFYKEMKIGTAAPTTEELAEVSHHFIGNLSIHEHYTVGDFEKDAIKKLNELFQKYDNIVMVGGSGMFEKAVTKGLDEFPKVDDKIRQNLNRKLENQGIVSLQKELLQTDPDYYRQVDLNNPVRIIRALEIYRGTGKPFSSFRKNQSVQRNFNCIKIGLKLPREEIYDRINRRVELMMETGLLEEAKSLYPFKQLNSLQTVGYKELFEFMDGKTDLETAVEEIKKNTRRYAKRQLTWYRKDQNIKWFSPFEKEKILEFISLSCD
ncbi:MAG: tRNA (adenosine(37)-N6)-dimethylallyltransferase MiaA [Weeksellaceae bacterium]|jgi:tRNA dimethylallyltransferase|nr:tRNA (adenosine(37)-N6)-dimethylallyltransferase MiaA [Weeksellaceae bacterium]